MKTELNLIERQVLWVVGSLERLATLGFFDPDVPLQINKDFIDVYLEIDENRSELFDNLYDLAHCLFGCLEVNQEGSFPEDQFESIFRILIEYKDRRDDVVKFALANNMSM